MKKLDKFYVIKPGEESYYLKDPLFPNTFSRFGSIGTPLLATHFKNWRRVKELVFPIIQERADLNPKMVRIDVEYTEMEI